MRTAIEKLKRLLLSDVTAFARLGLSERGGAPISTTVLHNYMRMRGHRFAHFQKETSFESVQKPLVQKRLRSCCHIRVPTHTGNATFRPWHSFTKTDTRIVIRDAWVLILSRTRHLTGDTRL